MNASRPHDSLTIRFVAVAKSSTFVQRQSEAIDEDIGEAGCFDVLRIKLRRTHRRSTLFSSPVGTVHTTASSFTATM